MINNLGFEFDHILWLGFHSGIIANPQTHLAAIASTDVACNDCGHQWQSHRIGAGAFQQARGAIVLTCPHCGQRGRVQHKALRAYDAERATTLPSEPDDAHRPLCYKRT